MDTFASLLPQLGVQLTDWTGHIPFTVQGPLSARSITVDGSVSSQFITGLLFAISEAAAEPVVITVSNPVSHPYLQLTVSVLNAFGRRVHEKEKGVYLVSPSEEGNTDDLEITVESDWSGAAAALVAAATSGAISFEHLDPDSLQADASLLPLLVEMGADVKHQNGSIHVSKAPLRSFEFDATNCPDLFPLLAILAASCEGESRIHGLDRLFHKESNRSETTQYLLSQFKIPFSIEGNTLTVEGTGTLAACTINSHSDHRIVMAATTAALRADGPVTIEGAEAVEKSYPAFFKDFQSLGVSIALQNS
jgi:3-phosphoshikimate 1-carboxyvinyltransferase